MSMSNSNFDEGKFLEERIKQIKAMGFKIPNRKMSEESRHNISLSLKGREAWNKGIPATEESKRKNSLAHRDKEHSTETREKMSMSHANKPLSETHKQAIVRTYENFSVEERRKQTEKAREANTGKPLSKEHAARISAAQRKGYQKHPELWAKRIEQLTYFAQHQHPMLGKSHSKESRLKNSLSHKGIQEGENNPFYGRHHSAETKVLISQKFRQWYDNLTPEEKSNWIEKTEKAACKAIQAKPNQIEEILDKLLQENFPGKWEYTGNSELTVGGKRPDFADTTGEHKLIELYGDYWHRGEDPQEKVDYFANAGFDCLVIWEHELKNLEEVKRKVALFMSISTYSH